MPMYKKRYFCRAAVFCMLFLTGWLTGCEERRDNRSAGNISFYLPSEYADEDYNSIDFRWCFARSKESEHFFLFWEPGFGDDPNGENIPGDMRVDTDDLLKKAEQFYRTNVAKLGFSNEELLYGYKLQIYLMYDKDWLATGAGYDNKVGALWITPMTCQPAGSVIAHEIGHAFQYLIYCRQLAEGIEDSSESGFRYGYPGSNGGNALWEICAQWQSWKDYPEEAFTDYEMETWFEHYHRSLENELSRYQNYWFFYYLEETQGTAALQGIWNESRYPEDCYSAYMRLFLDNDLNMFYEQLFKYAVRTVTFDYDEIRAWSQPYQGRYDTILYDAGDGFWQVAYTDCPEANGFSVVPVPLDEGTSEVTVTFRGLAPGAALAEGDPGSYYVGEELAAEKDCYNSYAGVPGWRYGFVSLLDNGTRVYGEMHDESEGIATFEIPDGAVYLYFVVLGAPEEYVCHGWDDTEENDVQMPYALKMEVH